ncbi:MAG: hypothetical protein ACR2FQ_11920 [Pseudonocardiaceae bacterium]
MSPARRSGLVLLGGAAVVLVLASPVALGRDRPLDGFFTIPLLSGLAFLAAAAAGGRRSPLWGTGVAVSVWGALVLLHYHSVPPFGAVGGPPWVVNGVFLLIGGVVAVVLGGILRLGGRTIGVLAAVVLSALLYAAALNGVPYAAVWWPYAVVPALRGLWEFRPGADRQK